MIRIRIFLVLLFIFLILLGGINYQPDVWTMTCKSGRPGIGWVDGDMILQCLPSSGIPRPTPVIKISGDSS